MATKLGYYKDAALDVTSTRFSKGTLVGTAVTSNSFEKALQFHCLTGFAGPAGNTNAEVVDSSTMLKAMRRS